MKEKDLKTLEGKTIKTIEKPNYLEITDSDDYTATRADDNILITFTDGTILKLGSWDYEGYSSGISKEIVNPHAK